MAVKAPILGGDNRRLQSGEMSASDVQASRRP